MSHPLPPDGDRPAGYAELFLRNRPFRRLFLARLISLLGDWFTTLALLALLRQIGGGEALAFGWVIILKTLPSVLMTPWAGVLVDRLPRKALMIAMDLVRAGLVLCIIGVEHVPVVGLLYGLVFVKTAASAVAEPARNAVLPDLVHPRDLVTANAMSAVSWSLMFTLGTALGGLVTAGLGWKAALFIDMLTYLISAALVVDLPVPPVHHDGDAERPTFRAGVGYLLAHPRALTLTLVKSGWSLAGAITLVITILGERVHAASLAGLGGWGDPALLAVTALYVARGVGTGLGPILARRIAGNDPARAERLMAFAFFWAAACYLLLGQTEHLVPAAACLVLAHLGGSTVWVFSTVRLQASTPSRVRGRVFACEQGGFTLTMSLSTYVFSRLIDADVAPLLTIATWLGGVMLVPGILWCLRGRLLGWGPVREESDAT